MMRRIIGAALLLAFTWPISVVADVDTSPTDRFRHAQEMRRSGDAEGALAVLDALRSEFPRDVDYAFGRAQLLVELGRDGEALDELRAATLLAPDYEDVWKLRLRLLARMEDSANRGERERVRRDAAERFPDATWWIAAPGEDEPQYTLLVGAGVDDLSNGLPTWNNQFIELQLRQDASRFYVARLARSERYGTTDTTLGVGVEQSWQSGWFAGAELSTAGGPDYLPELGLTAHVGRALDDSWVVDLALRRREFENATVSAAVGTIEKYAGAWRYAYSLTGSRLHGASGFFGHQASATRYYADASSIGLAVNAGDEAEVLEGGAVLESSVRGVTISGNHALNDRFALRWWLGTQEQGDFYTRRYVGLAISVRL
jgi:YaiO family outer membrane protein